LALPLLFVVPLSDQGRVRSRWIKRKKKREIGDEKEAVNLQKR